MEQVIQKIYVNVGQPSNLQCIHAMQHDYESMDILAYVMDKNIPYDISDCDSVHIQGATANKMAIDVSANSFAGNQVVFSLSKNMLASPGVMELSIVFTKDGKKISTFPFAVCVTNRPLGQMSKAEINILDEYVNRAKYYYLLSKSFAEGDTGIRTEENTDNSKYYYQQIKKLIEDGGNIGDTGGVKKLYYKTYAAFKTDYDAGKIEPESLILIRNDTNVPITPPAAPKLKSRFLAIGKGATSYSYDGINWVDMPGANQNDYLYDVVYGNGKFVSICLDGSAYYSSDGETWNKCTGLDNDGKYQRLAFGNNLFMCVDFVKTKVFVSSDGETWTNSKTFGETGQTYGIFDEGEYYKTNQSVYDTSQIVGKYNAMTSRGGDFTFFKNIFILSIHTNSGTKICYSEDGITWSDCLDINNSVLTKQTMSLDILSAPNYGLCRLMAFEKIIFYEDKYTFLYSSDGKIWNGVWNNSIFGITKYDCFTYKNDKIVMVNHNSGKVNTVTKDFTETINSDWQQGVTTTSLSTTTEIGSMVYDGNKYIIFESKNLTSNSSNTFTAPFYVSFDGITWRTETATFHCNGLYPDLITKLEYCNGTYIAIAQAARRNNGGNWTYNNRIIFYSTDDCKTWNVAKDFNDGITAKKEDMITIKYIDTSL